MKLSEYKQEYYEFSKLASDNNRTAAFAGIALVWLFRELSSTALAVPRDLLGPLVCFALAVALDLLHYVVATAIWSRFHRYHEAKLLNVHADPEVDHPAWFELPIRMFFLAKIVACLSGYGWLATHVWRIVGR